MAIHKIEYRFTSKPWKHTGQGGWYFISLPQDLSKEIREFFKSEEKGWGRLPVIAQIATTEWKTAIWFDTKKDTYLLPLKAAVRRKENITGDKPLKVVVFV